MTLEARGERFLRLALHHRESTEVVRARLHVARAVDLDRLAERTAHIEQHALRALRPLHPRIHAGLLLLRCGLHHLLEARLRRPVENEEFLHGVTPTTRTYCDRKL